MDTLFEFILELFVEGGVEIGSDKKVSRWIRYPLILFVSLFFIAIIFFCMWTGVQALLHHNLMGIFCIGVGLFLMIGCIWIFRKKFR